MTTPIEQAATLLHDCTVMQVATIDDNGFPNIISLTPLKLDRSVTKILFYTSRDTVTVRNMLREPVVALYAFNEIHHASVLFRAKATVISATEVLPQLVSQLNSFQKSLQYERPVIVECRPLTAKVRYNNNIAFQSLLHFDEDDSDQ